jgi:hypothetical protein
MMEARFTLEKRDGRTVLVKDSDSTSRCTIMFGGSLCGEKVEPYNVFKQVKGGCISQDLNNNIRRDILLMLLRRMFGLM